MPQYVYLIIAIAIIASIILIFFITFIHNRRTPVPEGCENIKIEESTCLACSNIDCNIHQKFDLEKVKKELEELEEDDK